MLPFLHPYLSESAAVYRLVSEYKKHNSLVIAYDFDNTVFDYHEKGQNYCDIINLLHEAKGLGLYLIVFTAREDIHNVRAFLEENKIPFDRINENPPFHTGNGRKIYYNLLLDDRAGLLSAYNQLNEVMHIIKNKI